jgi:uncharacterized integral membrane protein (TIGR00698 family)
MLRRAAPGVLLCAGLALLAWGGQRVQQAWMGHALMEGIALAIVLGVAVAPIARQSAVWQPGVGFCAKQLLEFAVFLLGASVNLPELLRAGPLLIAGIVLTVVVALAAGYGIARALGLQHQLAVLIACGNAICGNSAIAAVALVIRAKAEDVAASIAITAILGVGLVLILPPVGHALALSSYQYGVVAGLTVYAVPQVIAATFVFSPLAGQVGTLVKLVRVLMLGPMVLLLAIAHHDRTAERRLRLGDFVPWFIAGFVALAAVRSAGLINDAIAQRARDVTTSLTMLSMAAMGLGVDLRGIRRVGGAVATAVIGSLVVLLAASIALIWALRIS